MRCPDCNKFVSFDSETDPEISDEAVAEDGTVTANVRIVNNCSECGTELKEATLELDLPADKELIAHIAKCPDAKKPDGLTVDEISGSRTDRIQRTDRHGKPIRNPRYMRRYYGADITASVACACGETIQLHGQVETQASGMEELV